MRNFRLIDLVLLTGMVAAVFALRQFFEPPVELFVGFLPGAVFMLRGAERSTNPDFFLRVGMRIAHAALGGSVSSIFCGLIFFSTVEVEDFRSRPIAITLLVGTVFGVVGALGGVACGALYAVLEEFTRHPAVDEATPL
jgi:hypothetical protein